jgi:hypothetical protein
LLLAKYFEAIYIQQLKSLFKFPLFFIFPLLERGSKGDLSLAAKLDLQVSE